MSIHKPIIQRVARGTLARASAARDMVPQCLCWLLAPLFWEGRAVLFVAEGSLKVKVVLGVGACWELERGWSCSFVLYGTLMMCNVVCLVLSN